MANSVGALTVLLGLDASEYTRGLTKAERDAQKFKQAIANDVAKAARAGAAAMTALASAALAAGLAIDQLAKGAATFKDLEEKTGASAEGLASMAVAAGVAGTEMNTIAAASVKLTKGLVGVDDESKAAGAALGALGINVKQFKALDPAAQMEAVAKALAGFADGAGKTAVAVALFGKAGADMLPFLKELAGESGRQIILTQKQIEQADAYADAQARLTTQIRLYAQSLAADVIPLATDFIAKLVESQRAATSLFEALKTFTTLGVFSTAEEDVVRLVKEINQLEQKIAAIKAKGPVTIFGIETGIGKTDNLEANLAKLRRAFDAAQAVIAARNAAENKGPETRPALKFEGAGAATKALKEQTSAAQRYLDQLEKQLIGEQNLTVAETALLEILELKKKATAGLTPELERQIFLTAQQIDAAKAQKKAEDEARKAAEEAARAHAQAVKQGEQEIEQIRHGNEQLQEQIAFLRGGEEAVNAMTDAKLQAAIADKQAALAAIEYNDANKELILIAEEQIRLLKERQALLGDKRLAEQMVKDAQAAKVYTDIFANSFADAVTSVVDGTKSVSQAFKDMEKQIVAAITRIAAQGLAEQLFGKGGAAGGLGGFFAKLFGGAGGGAGTSAPFFGGDGGGIPGWASGTSFHPGGWAKVGEQGPELVRLPRGSQVIPNEKLGSKSVVVNINQRFDGNTSRTSAGQAGAMAAKSVRRAMDRYA